MNGDEYHLHFASIDGDYFERLMDGAAKLANPLRLMLRTYSPEEEAAVRRLWQGKLMAIKAKPAGRTAHAVPN